MVRLPGLAPGPQRLRPVAGRLRQCRDHLTWPGPPPSSARPGRPRLGHRLRPRRLGGPPVGPGRGCRGARRSPRSTACSPTSPRRTCWTAPTPPPSAARMAPAATLAEALAGCRLGAGERARGPGESSASSVARPRRASPTPSAILASSTSAIVPSRFTEALAGRARCLDLPPDQPALPDPRGRAGPGTLDRADDHGPRRGGHARHRPGADRHARASSTASS